MFRTEEPRLKEVLRKTVIAGVLKEVFRKSDHSSVTKARAPCGTTIIFGMLNHWTLPAKPVNSSAEDSQATDRERDAVNTRRAGTI